jgi:NAD(P)-dependent dehydrogenase (short-subunit alcohol dehydrogenase family)
MDENTPQPPAAILVTGASTGIGKACALELDRRGFRVFAGVRSDSAAAQLRAEASPRLTPITIDVTVADTIAVAAKTIADSVGDAGPAGLVNNAGIAVGGPLEIIPIDALRRQFEVNVVGQIAVIQAMLPSLRKARGRIVNITSVSGGLAAPYFGPYAASKFAMEAASDALRIELRRWGIRVACVEPGPIATSIWQKSVAFGEQLAGAVDPARLALYDADLEAVRKSIDQSIRIASPVERVVEAVAHALTSPRPKSHYYLGWTVRVCFKGMKMLPDRVRDWIVRKVMGLS